MSAKPEVSLRNRAAIAANQENCSGRTVRDEGIKVLLKASHLRGWKWLCRRDWHRDCQQRVAFIKGAAVRVHEKVLQDEFIAISSGNMRSVKAPGRRCQGPSQAHPIEAGAVSGAAPAPWRLAAAPVAAPHGPSRSPSH